MTGHPGHDSKMPGRKLPLLPSHTSTPQESRMIRRGAHETDCGGEAGSASRSLMAGKAAAAKSRLGSFTVVS